MESVLKKNIYKEIAGLIGDTPKVITTSVGEIEITPLKFPTVVNIMGCLESLKMEQRYSLETINLEAMLYHHETIESILIAIMHNKKGNPPKQLKEMLMRMNASDLLKITEDIDYNEFVSRLSEKFQKNLKKEGENSKRKFNPFEFINNCLKYFRYKYEELIWEIPFSALIGINLFTPSFEEGKEEGEKSDGSTRIVEPEYFYNKYKTGK